MTYASVPLSDEYVRCNECHAIEAVEDAFDDGEVVLCRYCAARASHCRRCKTCLPRYDLNAEQICGDCEHAAPMTTAEELRP